MKNLNNESAETWNKIASLYESKFMDLDLYNVTYDMFCEALRSANCKVLEIGCGPGNIARYLLQQRPELSILGIDLAPNMITLAAKNNPSAEFRAMDCRDISSLEDKYDGIICGFCLPYLSEDEMNKLLANCHDLLSPQGILYLSFVEGDPQDSGYKTGSSGDRTYFYFYTIEQIKSALLNNGFESIEAIMVNYPRGEDTIEEHTILLCRKGG
ncbi:MAG: class I SAM-dependent methyltransferase [Saprospiraceae bacterium]